VTGDYDREVTTPGSCSGFPNFSEVRLSWFL